MLAAIVSNVRFYREGIAAALAADGIESVAIDNTASDIARVCTDIDVALIDLVEGELAAAIAALRAGTPIVGLALSARPQVAVAAALGVRAFVGCDQTLAELVATTKRAAADEAVCPSSIADELFASLGRARDRQPARSIDVLTRREQEIARLVVNGLSNKQIASQLVIEPATVKNHVHQILRKLHVHRRGEAAALLHDTWTERSTGAQAAAHDQRRAQ